MSRDIPKVAGRQKVGGRSGDECDRIAILHRVRIEDHCRHDQHELIDNPQARPVPVMHKSQQNLLRRSTTAAPTQPLQQSDLERNTKATTLERLKTS